MQYQSIHLWQGQHVVHVDTLQSHHAEPNTPTRGQLLCGKEGAMTQHLDIWSRSSRPLPEHQVALW